MDCYNCMICTCWICCNDRDYWRWLVEIACRKNLPLSITARADKDVTRYECGKGQSCITVGGDQE